MVLPGPLIETWVLYGAGSLIIFARILCRWRMIGPANFKPDDYLIVPAWVGCASVGPVWTSAVLTGPHSSHTRP